MSATSLHKSEKMQKNPLPKHILLSFFAGIIFILSINWAYQLANGSGGNILDKDLEQIRTKGQRYTSPLLECSDTQPLRVDLFSKLESKLGAMVSEDIDSDGVEMSVYLRDLTNGGWVDLGSKELYQPASLMKLPTLIAAYQKKDTTPEYFDEVIETSEPYGINATQNIVSGIPLKNGEKTTIENLVERIVINSDNKAHDNLVSKIGTIRIESLLEDFGIPPLTTPEEYKISPRIYARFLRILYNATYLSKSSSEELLMLLSKSKFEKGLRAGVPKDVKIASKFGERVMQEQGVTKYQLHDCGIVYARRPYILCIMTKGASFEPLYAKISEVSRTIYSVMQ